MKLLADMHVSPRTVVFLRNAGHDVARVNEIADGTISDEAIVALAEQHGRVILTQDLDFSAIVALSGRTGPSLISLRLTSSRIEDVNAVLAEVLPPLEDDVIGGVVVTVEDTRVRVRRLPIAG